MIITYPKLRRTLCLLLSFSIVWASLPGLCFGNAFLAPPGISAADTGIRSELEDSHKKRIKSPRIPRPVKVISAASILSTVTVFAGIKIIMTPGVFTLFFVGLVITSHIIAATSALAGYYVVGNLVTKYRTASRQSPLMPNVPLAPDQKQSNRRQFFAQSGAALVAGVTSGGIYANFIEWLLGLDYDLRFNHDSFLVKVRTVKNPEVRLFGRHTDAAAIVANASFYSIKGNAMGIIVNRGSILNPYTRPPTAAVNALMIVDYKPTGAQAHIIRAKDSFEDSLKQAGLLTRITDGQTAEVRNNDTDTWRPLYSAFHAGPYAAFNAQGKITNLDNWTAGGAKTMIGILSDGRIAVVDMEKEEVPLLGISWLGIFGPRGTEISPLIEQAQARLGATFVKGIFVDSGTTGVRRIKKPAAVIRGGIIPALFFFFGIRHLFKGAYLDNLNASMLSNTDFFFGSYDLIDTSILLIIGLSYRLYTFLTTNKAQPLLLPPAQPPTPIRIPKPSSTNQSV